MIVFYQIVDLRNVSRTFVGVCPYHHQLPDAFVFTHGVEHGIDPSKFGGGFFVSLVTLKGSLRRQMYRAKE